jgi:hypothetical protein
MVERFSQEQVNHYLWQRQGFSARESSRSNGVLDDVIGIYGTAPTCYLSLLARDANFRFSNLDDLLYEQRYAARIRAMRYSLFMVTQTLLPAVYQASLQQSGSNFWNIEKLTGLTEAQYQHLAQTIEHLLCDRNMTVSEIKKALPPDTPVTSQGLDFVIPMMCNEGRIVRANVRGGWKSVLFEYARFDRWLPDVNLNTISPEEARVVLAREYFDSYGPATAEDFRWWSGLLKPDAERAVASLDNELTLIETDDVQYQMLTTKVDALRDCPAEAPPGVRLLPVWDAYLMAYKDRARYVPQKWYDCVYAKTGDATSTVLLNGTVGGIWDFQEVKKTLVVKVALFERANRGVWDELHQQLIRFANAANYPSASLVRCAAPVTLKGGSQNLFKAPLKDVEGEMVFEV